MGPDPLPWFFPLAWLPPELPHAECSCPLAPTPSQSRPGQGGRPGTWCMQGSSAVQSAFVWCVSLRVSSGCAWSGGTGRAPCSTHCILKATCLKRCHSSQSVWTMLVCTYPSCSLCCESKARNVTSVTLRGPTPFLMQTGGNSFCPSSHEALSSNCNWDIASALTLAACSGGHEPWAAGTMLLEFTLMRAFPHHPCSFQSVALHGVDVTALRYPLQL